MKKCFLFGLMIATIAMNMAIDMYAQVSKDSAFSILKNQILLDESSVDII